MDFTGAESAAHASVKNATASKGRFIAALPGLGGCRLAPCVVNRRLACQHRYQTLVSAPLLGQGKWLRALDKLFRGRLGDETSSQGRDRNPEC